MILQYELTRDVPELDARSGDVVTIYCESRRIEVTRRVAAAPATWQAAARAIPSSRPIMTDLPADAAVALTLALDPRKGLHVTPPTRARRPRLRVAHGGAR